MNKKRLSVVMAGAMLATSVAPVLAAETTATTKEYSVGQKELLIKYLNDKLAEKEFTNNSVLVANDATAQKYLGITVAGKLNTIMKTNVDGKANVYDKSVYQIKINGELAVNNLSVADTSNTKTIEKLLKNIKVGDKVEIFERENTTFLGQIIPAKETTKAIEEDKAATYSASDLKPGDGATGDFDGTSGLASILKANRFVAAATCTEQDKATIKLHALKDRNNTASNIELNIKKDDVKYDLNLPVDKDGNLLDISKSASEDELQECVGFLKETKWDTAVASSVDPVKVETINVVADAPTEEEVTYNASDLYDGTLLTEKGTELLNDIKNKVVVDGGHSVELESPLGNATNGISEFKIEYKSKGGTLLKTVTVKSNVREEIKTVHKMLEKGTYAVGIVAGQNRYSTAVNVAKESGVTALSASGLNNVVLVNGGSLVDGLAAAPLANEKGNSGISAPLLLTKTDSLPTETKEYLNKLIEAVPAKDLSKITINLVGGKSVLSDSLVKELRGMGFNVVRYGGDNREETSLKVAAALTNAAGETFVVGANGEADAMSISAVAASTKTPIIVSSVHGLTDEATDYLATKAGNTTIIGGEKAISKEEEEKIKEAKEGVAGGTFRIAGANRTETNAKILDKYATTLNSKKLTVVKDGSNNKEELVDALSAANLGGPIVLANSKVSDAQLTELLNLAKNNKTKLLQVGLGLEDSVIKSLSKTLDITNKDYNFN